MPWAISRSRLREKLSKAGPAKGRTSSADSVNELTTTPTMEAVAPSESANTGSVALAMNAAIDWKKFTAIRMTKGALQMESLAFPSDIVNHTQSLPAAQAASGQMHMRH